MGLGNCLYQCFATGSALAEVAAIMSSIADTIDRLRSVVVKIETARVATPVPIQTLDQVYSAQLESRLLRLARSPMPDGSTTAADPVEPPGERVRTACSAVPIVAGGQRPGKFVVRGGVLWITSRCLPVFGDGVGVPSCLDVGFSLGVGFPCQVVEADIQDFLQPSVVHHIGNARQRLAVLRIDVQRFAAGHECLAVQAARVAFFLSRSIPPAVR